MSDAAIEHLLRRDRAIVLAALFGLAALAWAYVHYGSLPQATGFIATLIGAIILGIASPFAGHLSDRFGRGGILTGMAWLFLLTTYPIFYLMRSSPRPQSSTIRRCRGPGLETARRAARATRRYSRP